MKASINEVDEQRNVERCKRLIDAIAKAEANGNAERAASLTAELERRTGQAKGVIKLIGDLKALAEAKADE